MNDKTKDRVKKNMATGASTAFGGAAGVVIGSVLTTEEAAAQDTIAPEAVAVEAVTIEPENEVSTQPEIQVNETEKPEPAKQEIHQEPATQHETSDEIEVIGYDRITNEEGNQVDLAVVNVNGNEMGIADTDLDGLANVIIYDANGNQIIEEDEIHVIENEVIPMQPLADEAGFNPLFAQNDLPDYVNDADVDTYMV